jgi:hypothetical protein
MLSKAQYNLRKSALKRQYNEALAGVDTSALTANPHIAEAMAKMEARKALRGQGLYMGGHGAFSLGGSAGRAIGGMFGNKHLGGQIGRAVGSLTGIGGYGTNALFEQSDMEVPSFHSSGDEQGAMCISYKEYVGDVFGNASGVTFSNKGYSLNPGLDGTFPWLSQLAQNYEEYEIKQLVWTYRSTTSDIGSSTTGQVGTIIMATNYNPDQPLFSDKKSMMEYYGAASVKSTDSLLSGVECDPSKLSGSEGKYVRTNPVLQNQDIKGYDAGIFQVAVCNTPTAMANLSLGELWVSYTIVLRKPKFYATLGLGIGRDLFVSGAGTESATQIMGTDAALLSGLQNNIGCALSLATANAVKITFPANYAGNVAILLNVESQGGTGLVCAANYFVGTVSTTTGNVSYINDIYAAGSSASDSPSYYTYAPVGTITGNNKLMYIVHVNVQQASLGVDNSLTINTSFSSIGSGNTQSVLEITEYNNYARLLSNPAPVLVNTSGVVVVP